MRGSSRFCFAPISLPLEPVWKAVPSLSLPGPGPYPLRTMGTQMNALPHNTLSGSLRREVPRAEGQRAVGWGVAPERLLGCGLWAGLLCL